MCVVQWMTKTSRRCLLHTNSTVAQKLDLIEEGHVSEIESAVEDKRGNANYALPCMSTIKKYIWVNKSSMRKILTTKNKQKQQGMITNARSSFLFRLVIISC